MPPGATILKGTKPVIDQLEKANAFRDLHENSETFIIPNPWDVGSAQLLEKVGFKALATTSSGFAHSIGKADGQVSLDEKLAHCRDLAAATNIPISADFEDGFAADPKEAAANLIKLAATGVVGGSIEDYSRTEIYDFDLAVDRVAACAEAARSLSFPFTLTARAEGVLRGVGDLDAAMERIQAYQAVGADVLYIPGLRTLAEVDIVVNGVSKPVNVLAPFMPDTTLADYAAHDVGRISIGGALANHAVVATRDAATNMLATGNFAM